MGADEPPFYELGDIVRTINPPKKIKKNAYLKNGKFPVIDQSANFIAGWTNDATAVVQPPSDGFIIFGDHSCVLKFAEIPFAQGADGLKIIEVNQGINAHFVYAHLIAFPLLNDGYKRHFSELKRVKIRLPDEKVQNAVSGFLHTFDSKIALNTKVAQSLEKLAETMFKSWFIDFDPVKAKMAGEAPVGMDAETAALFPGSMAHSALGSIPAGWEVASAGSTFDITIGRTPPRKETEWFCAGDTGVPWLSIRDMGTFGVFSGSTSEGLTHEAIARHRVPVVPEGTVLMSFKLTLGRICIASEQLATNEAIAHFVRTDKTPVDSWFTYLWLKAQDLENLESTSSIATATNSSFIRALPFLIPDAPVTEAFKSLVEPLFLQVLNLSKQNQALSSLRDKLLPRLISGELEIPDEMLAA